MLVLVPVLVLMIELENDVSYFVRLAKSMAAVNMMVIEVNKNGWLKK